MVVYEEVRRGLGDAICIPAHSHVSHRRDLTSEEFEIIHFSSACPKIKKTDMHEHREK